MATKKTEAAAKTAQKAVKDTKAAAKTATKKATKTAEKADKAVKETAKKAEKTVKEAAKKAEKKVEKVAEKVEKKAEKKTAAKKTTAPKKTTKKAASEVYFEFAGKQIDPAKVAEDVKAAYVAGGNKASSIKSVKIYVKAEDCAAYFVINDKETGKIVL